MASKNPTFNEEPKETVPLNEDHNIRDKNDGMKTLEESEPEETSQQLDGNEKVEEPKEGMAFNSTDDLLAYYRKYGQQQGFGVNKRTSRSNDDGKVVYITLACARTGKSKTNGMKSRFKLNPARKTQCMAKLNALLCPDGKFRLTTVVLEHNHVLSPDEALLFSRKRKMNIHKTKKQKQINQAEGSSHMGSILIGMHQFDNTCYGKENLLEHIQPRRQPHLECCDIEAMHDFFSQMQHKNSNFFYMMDFDDNCRLKCVFWADARNRAMYEAFADVITIDTTYMTNQYNIPLVLFRGVNHHGQSVLLGSGLVLNYDTETFVHLFESWLDCMSGCSPIAVITNQDEAIQNAVEAVFPKSRHRWCLVHVMKLLSHRLKYCPQYELLKPSFESVVYDTLTKEEFEERWARLTGEYELMEDEWLKNLYDERCRWVPVYLKDTFWAGMSTMKRTESVSPFFDDHLDYKTNLKQFFKQYDNVLRSKIVKENQADYDSFNSMIPCITHYDIEKQIQEVYTNTKFKEFQEELTGKIYCELSFAKEQDVVTTYEVVEDVHIGGTSKHVIFKVSFNEEHSELQCSCKLFECKGILCRHAICLLNHKKVKSIPSNYILSRWRKDLKRGYSRVKVSYDDRSVPDIQRLDEMQKLFDEVAEVGTDSNNKCMMVVKYMRELKEKLCAITDDGRPQTCQLPTTVSQSDVSDACVSSLSKGDGGTVDQVDRTKRMQHCIENRHKRRQKKGSEMESERNVINAVPISTVNPNNLMGYSYTVASPGQMWGAGYAVGNFAFPGSIPQVQAGCKQSLPTAPK